MRVGTALPASNPDDQVGRPCAQELAHKFDERDAWPPVPWSEVEAELRDLAS
jgi:hypothetical protein